MHPRRCRPPVNAVSCQVVKWLAARNPCHCQTHIFRTQRNRKWTPDHPVQRSPSLPVRAHTPIQLRLSAPKFTSSRLPANLARPGKIKSRKTAQIFLAPIQSADFPPQIGQGGQTLSIRSVVEERPASHKIACAWTCTMQQAPSLCRLVTETRLSRSGQTGFSVRRGT